MRSQVLYWAAQSLFTNVPLASAPAAVSFPAAPILSVMKLAVLDVEPLHLVAAVCVVN